ncbi:hypothetical protein BTVI_108509 [Pitangus sulphuratus]|nr:hypothetical protein BTVI_108509 [Pitangus sulphuratus]
MSKYSEYFLAPFKALLVIIALCFAPNLRLIQFFMNSCVILICVDYTPKLGSEVTDQSVKAFAEHCPELQYVGFMGCSVTSKGVIHLTNLRNLSSLDLRHITELDNETVMEIVKRCKNLNSLNLCLNWIINDSLWYLADGCEPVVVGELRAITNVVHCNEFAKLHLVVNAVKYLLSEVCNDVPWLAQIEVVI